MHAPSGTASRHDARYLRLMRGLLGGAATAAALLIVAGSVPAEAHPPVRLMCADWKGEAPDYFRSIPRRAPRQCTIAHEDWASYQMLNFINARWRDFGRPYAKATVTVTGNMNYRAPGVVTAYRRR